MLQAAAAAAAAQCCIDIDQSHDGDSSSTGPLSARHLYTGALFIHTHRFRPVTDSQSDARRNGDEIPRQLCLAVNNNNRHSLQFTINEIVYKIFGAMSKDSYTVNKMCTLRHRFCRKFGC